MSTIAVAQQPPLLAVQPVCEEVTTRQWRSQVRPEIVVTGEKYDLPVLAWADAHPHVYDVASNTRSKAYGRNSCAHIGWAQRSQAPEAVFERVRTLYRDLHDPLKGKGLALGSLPRACRGGAEGACPEPAEGIFQWRARFTFEHYRDKGFTGGVFFSVTGTSRGYGDLLTLDYTPALLDEVARRFAAWCCKYPGLVAVVVKKGGWKGAEICRWEWEELWPSSS